MMPETQIHPVSGELPDINAGLTARVVINTNEMIWESSPSGSVWRKPLYREGGEFDPVTSVVRYVAGGSFHAHRHPEGEEILVLNGTFSDETGDYSQAVTCSIRQAAATVRFLPKAARYLSDCASMRAEPGNQCG